MGCGSSKFPTSAFPLPTSKNLSSVLCHRSSDFCPLSSDFCALSSGIYLRGAKCGSGAKGLAHRAWGWALGAQGLGHRE
jgi:hypothetical protein